MHLRGRHGEANNRQCLPTGYVRIAVLVSVLGVHGSSYPRTTVGLSGHHREYEPRIIVIHLPAYRYLLA